MARRVLTAEEIEARRQKAREYAKKWNAENRELKKELNLQRRGKRSPLTELEKHELRERAKERRAEQRGHRYEKIPPSAALVREHEEELSRRAATKREEAEFRKGTQVERMRARNHGIEVVELRRRLADADGKCELCGSESTRLCLDHDHKTGKLRGVVCRRCNHILGLMDEIDGMSVEDRQSLLEFQRRGK